MKGGALAKKQYNRYKDFEKAEKVEKMDILTLECVLNVLDGILELHNAMIIFTTNIALENMDPAFIRAGRIDYKLKLDYCSVRTVRDILRQKYGDFDVGLLADIKDGVISPCDVQNMCFICDTVEECIYRLFTLIAPSVAQSITTPPLTKLNTECQYGEFTHPRKRGSV
jgi:hypothetical protein